MSEPVTTSFSVGSTTNPKGTIDKPLREVRCQRCSKTLIGTAPEGWRSTQTNLFALQP
jgi:hypothetical protein